MSNDLEWWGESLGRIELQIAREDAESALHPGPCDADVSRLRDVPYIGEQLDKLSPALVAEYLRECGAWDAEELANHENNLDRLLWIACCDISEECFIRESEED